jgi:hypothetical protein
MLKAIRIRATQDRSGNGHVCSMSHAGVHVQYDCSLRAVLMICKSAVPGGIYLCSLPHRVPQRCACIQGCVKTMTVSSNKHTDYLLLSTSPGGLSTTCIYCPVQTSARLCSNTRMLGPLHDYYSDRLYKYGRCTLADLNTCMPSLTAVP